MTFVLEECQICAWNINRLRSLKRDVYCGESRMWDRHLQTSKCQTFLRAPDVICPHKRKCSLRKDGKCMGSIHRISDCIYPNSNLDLIFYPGFTKQMEEQRARAYRNHSGFSEYGYLEAMLIQKAGGKLVDELKAMLVA